MPAAKEQPAPQPRSRLQRSYSDQEKADAFLALEANGGNVAATSMELGIPYRTLYYWVSGKGVHPEVQQLIKEKRLPLIDRLEQLIQLIAEGMDSPEKIAAATLNQLSVAMGVLIDKVRLLKGEAPSGTPAHPNARVVPQSVLIVMDPSTPEARVANEVARLGLRRPVDFGASACPTPSPPE